MMMGCNRKKTVTLKVSTAVKRKTHLSGFLEKYEQTRKEVNLQSICCAGSNSSSSAQTYSETLQSLIFSSFTLTKHLRSSAHHLKHHHSHHNYRHHHHLARTRDHCFLFSLSSEQTKVFALVAKVEQNRSNRNREGSHAPEMLPNANTHTHADSQAGRQPLCLRSFSIPVRPN